MTTPVTEITYPPIDSQATYTFIDSQITESQKTGKVQDDFKLALFTQLGLPGDNNDYSIDDLWHRYIVTTISGDGNTKPGNPASAGRGHGGHVGQHMAQYYSRAHRKNPGNANAFPGGQTIQPSQVVFRASYNGNPGQTSHVSQDSGERVATFTGTTSIVNTKVVFGSSSLQGAASGYVSYPASTDFDIPAGADWTIESWSQSPGFGNDYHPIISLPGAFILGIDITGTYGGMKAVIYKSDNSTIDVDVTHTLLIGEIDNIAWNHIAFTKSGTTLRGFINGVLIFSTTVLNEGLGAAGVPLRIGSDPQDGTVLDGWIDSVRMIVGTALYTENFTPPTAPLYGGEPVELGAPMDCYYLEESWEDGGTPDLAALLVPFTTADQITGLDLNSDGTRVLLSNFADDETYSYLLSVPYDFSTAVETGASDTTTNPSFGKWGADGSTYTVHEVALDVYSQFTLGTPYVMEVTPAAHSNATEANLGVSGTNNGGFCWNSDGTAVYGCGNPGSAASVSRTPLTGAAYDLDSLGTPVVESIVDAIKSGGANGNEVWVDESETYIYVSNIAFVLVGIMSTPGDLSSVTWREDELRIWRTDEVSLEYVHPDGSYMLVANHKYNTPKIYKYSHQAGEQI